MTRNLVEKQREWKGFYVRLRAYTRRKGKREGERGRETKGERKAAGLVEYRSEWQVRDKSSGSGTSLRSAAIVWKGECRFLARINTPAGIVAFDFLLLT